ERRAREAREEAARLQIENGDTTAPQLELLPKLDPPDVNPIVTAALKRIERAHRAAVGQRAPYPNSSRKELQNPLIIPAAEAAPLAARPQVRTPSEPSTVTAQTSMVSGPAAAMAPVIAAAEPEPRAEAPLNLERTPTLVVVQPPVVVEPAPTP